MKQEDYHKKYYSNDPERNNTQMQNTQIPIKQMSKMTSGMNNDTNMNKEPVKEIGKINSLKTLTSNDHKLTKHNNDSKSNIRPLQLFFSTIINKIGSHNSYLGVTIHSLYHMKTYCDFIIKDLSDNALIDNPILFQLKATLIKYSQNKRIDISNLSKALSDLFGNNNQFSIDKPNDCSDCLFAFINLIHSLYMKYPLDSKCDLPCNNSCFVHRNYWLNLNIVDEFECLSMNQTNSSTHNFITDIPLTIILQYIKQKGYESHQKLFPMFHHLITNTKVLCPLHGLKCDLNYSKRIFKANQPLPGYLIFSYDTLSMCQWFLLDILKSLLVIPKYYDMNLLFPSNNKKSYYELFGFVFMKHNRSYTCCFKYNNPNDSDLNVEVNSNTNINWIYYDDDNVFTLTSLIDLVSLCLKNSLFPVLFYYKTILSNSNIKTSLSSPYCSLDEYRVLEKFAMDIDQYHMSTTTKFRPNELLYFRDNEIKRNNSHRKMHSHVIRNPSKTKNRIGNNDDDELSEYVCFNCRSNNRIECILCPNCGESNEKTIETTIKRRQKIMNMPFVRNINSNSNNSHMIITQAKVIDIPPRSKEVSSTPASIKTNFNSNNVSTKEGSQDANQKKLIISQSENKNYDLPRQIVPKKQDMIKEDNQLNQKTPMDKKNINESSNILLENRIKAYVITKNKESNSNNNSNYLTNNNSKEYSQMRPQTTQKPFPLPEMWICANCEKVNKATEYKCSVCGLINKKQRELITQNEKRINKSLDVNFTPSTHEINLSNQQQQLTAPSHPINLNTKFKKVSCACYSTKGSYSIMNGVCTQCNRRPNTSSINNNNNNNEADKETIYKYTKNTGSGKLKDKAGVSSSEMKMQMQNTKKSITAQNRYESEETSNNYSMNHNIRVPKDSTNVSPGYKKVKVEQQGYKKIMQKKK